MSPRFALSSRPSHLRRQRRGRPFIQFDEGQSMLEHLDLSKAKRPNQELKRVNVDFPIWMIQSLDKEAKRLGVPRQSIIKIWLAERLQKSTAA
jgi:hypothetical protein